MKNMAFIIFLSIVLSIYTLGNIYIFNKGINALHSYNTIKTWFTVIFCFLFLTYPAGRIVESFYLSYLSDVLIWIGSFWLAFLLYFFLISVFIDFLKLTNKFFSYMPELFFKDVFKFRVFWGVICFTTLMIIGGYINAKNLVVKNVEINIPKDAGHRKTLNAVFISDIHLGTIIGNQHLERIVSKINLISPEIIFMAGDIVDEDLQPVLRQNIGHTLKKIEAPLGVYAVTGNHEYIGGANEAIDYLEKHGITFLRDSVLKIDNSFYIIGREDMTMLRFTGEKRKSLEDLIGYANRSNPLILVDHQPLELEKAANEGVDLQLSGHTHHGQLWPLNYITSAIYKVSQGYENINNMHVYVTSGVGTWGPPVKTNSRSEIINIKINFE